MQSPSSQAWVTVEDLIRLPEDGTKREIVCGLLLSEPRPGALHGSVTARLVLLLGDHVRRHRLGTVLTADAGFLLARSPDTLRGPDVAFVSRARWEAVEDLTRAFPGPPDLAVEVLSPSDRPGELHAKIADYLAAGTRLVWVVNPALHTVTIHESLLEPRLAREGDILDGAGILPGLSVRVTELFEV